MERERDVGETAVAHSSSRYRQGFLAVNTGTHGRKHTDTETGRQGDGDGETNRDEKEEKAQTRTHTSETQR